MFVWGTQDRESSLRAILMRPEFARVNIATFRSTSLPDVLSQEPAPDHDNPILRAPEHV